MIKIPLLKQSFVLILIVGVLDIIGAVFHLHWAVWWFDTILHFLGGVWVAMTVLMLWYSKFDYIETNKLKIIGFTVLATFIVGFLWEVFEVAFDITFFSDGAIFARDTISDLILDTCGGFFATLYSMKVLRNSRITP